jgi:hypothetical protein
MPAKTEEQHDEHSLSWLSAPLHAHARCKMRCGGVCGAQQDYHLSLYTRMRLHVSRPLCVYSRIMSIAAAIVCATQMYIYRYI